MYVWAYVCAKVWILKGTYTEELRKRKIVGHRGKGGIVVELSQRSFTPTDVVFKDRASIYSCVLCLSTYTRLL